MKITDKIYVAGNTGLVGSAIIRALNYSGYRNLVFTPYPEYDLREQSVVTSFFEKEQPDYVFVAAARVGGIYANETYPAEFLYDNLVIESNLIHTAHKYSVQKLLFLGSSCIYPKLCPQPIKEEYLLTGELEPTNEPYAIAKIAGIKLCQYYRRQYGDDFISVMPTNLFGDLDNYNLANSHVLPAMIRKMYLAKLYEQGDLELIKKNFTHHEGTVLDAAQIPSELLQHGISISGDSVNLELWGTGNPRREFLYVDDLADCLLYLMENYSSELHINAGMGKDSTIREIAGMVQQFLCFKGSVSWNALKPDGTPQKLLDISKLLKLGWKPQHSFSTALEQTIKNYTSQFN